MNLYYKINYYLFIMNRDILKIITKYKTYNKPYHEELLLKTILVKNILNNNNKISPYSSYAFIIDKYEVFSKYKYK